MMEQRIEHLREVNDILRIYGKFNNKLQYNEYNE